MYGALGLAGVWRWPVLIAFGWATHVAWDLAVSGDGAAAYVPAWWPTFCVGTDLFLSGYITANTWRRLSILPRAAKWFLKPFCGEALVWSGCVYHDLPLGSWAESTDICSLRNHLAKEA